MATNNPQTVKLVSLGLKIFGSIPLLVGLCFLAGAGFTGHSRYTIINKWPTVDADVVRSQLASHQQTFANDTRPTTVYQALIDFHYTLGGKEYTVPTGADYSDSSYADMKQKVDTFAAGTHHAVRYNPVNPNDIRPDAGYTLGFFVLPLILAAVGLGVAGFGALLFAVGWGIGKAQTRCPSCGVTVGRSDGYCPACGAALGQSKGLA